MLINKKAVSTFILIILMLCSAVFGAFLSYMWVMAHFYLEPENTVDLVITEVNFPVDHADYFYVTVMNPSHSPSGTNITEIYFTVEGDNEVHNVRGTYPEELPIPLERATSKTIKCLPLLNWGNFAGKIITVHVSGVNASGAARSVRTEFVKLEVQAYFNATESCKYFNVTVFNSDGSAINLTLTKVYFDYELVENMSIQIPPSGLMIPTNGTIDFQCFVDWQGHGKPLVQVKTLEGYTAEISKEVSSVVILPITDVMFNETDPNEISITLFNGEESATPVDVTNVTLTDDNGTEYVVRLFDPPLRIENNETVTFNCVWNWTNYRDRNVTITAYTKQGFTSSPKTVETPQPIIFKITELRFNLTNTGFFLVNVTNMPCSLQDINITKIQFNETETSFESQIIPIGEERQFNCTFDWKDFRGGNVNITVYTADGLNISEGITLPSVDLKILVEEHDFAKSTEGILYVNVTIFNTVFSAQNVTITHIIFETENTTDVIDGKLTNPKLVPEGYVLIVDANVTIVCPWNWTLYPNQDVTITVQTAEGFSISQTFQIPESTS